MAIQSPARIAGSIQEALKRPNPLLFVGAGVGCRVGFPDWNQFIEHLATACETFEKASADLIRARAAKRQLLAAASVFKTCQSIPDGERFKLLCAPFARTLSDDDIKKLEPLLGLSFTAVVTTNYDSSLHTVASLLRRGWAMPVELGDISMRGAALLSDFFVARIHGRAEQPQTMVVDTRDYENVTENSAYLDFLLEILRTRSCLFVGFSFLDPAIVHILKLLDDRCRPNFPRLHTALIPAGDADLETHLRAVNIDTVVYDPAQEHAELWRGIRRAYEATTSSKGPSRPAITTPPSAALHQFMAFAYAQVAARPDRQPVAEIVQDGIVLSAVAESEPGCADAAVADVIRLTLRVSPDEAGRVAAASLERLIGRGYAVRTENGLVFRVNGGAVSLVEEHLSHLANGVADRLLVRERVKLSVQEIEVVRDALEGLFIWRAWDLAAHFAGSGAGMASDLPGVVGRVLDAERRGRKLRTPSGVQAAILDLLTAPEDREARMLAMLGRAAFGLQVVLATPRQALFQRYALPHRVYLDASVLMPAITEGHPLRPVYLNALKRLAETSRALATSLSLVVGRQFLNEIVSHRRNAVDLVRELGLEDPKSLNEHILFYTATNTNVFVGAYASWVGREPTAIAFEHFLRQVAPYGTEDELSKHLCSLGIETEDMRFLQRHNSVFVSIFNPLLDGYERDLGFGEILKDKLLIEHEAQQLTQLQLDLDRGLRTIFVTADNRLRRVMQNDSRFHALAGTTMSHTGLVAVVDVMVGLDVDSRSLARLLWATPHAGDEQAVFDYFVRLALRKYDEAMAMEMQEAARAVAEEAKKAAAEAKINLLGKSVEDVSRTAKFLDRYQDKFFQHMREAIERRQRE